MNTEDFKAYARAYTKEVRDFRRRQGLCVRCGKVPARQDRTTCQSCAERDNKKALTYYYKRKGEQNVAGQDNISEA
jgi:hypothetical protein